MKNLFSLILSAALLCPMWAGAQTKTIPSVLGPLHYSGILAFPPESGDIPCYVIRGFTMHVHVPNNESPVKPSDIVFTCINSSMIGFGTFVAMNGLKPASDGAPITGYLGGYKIFLGPPVKVNCEFTTDLMRATCKLAIPIPITTNGEVWRYEYKEFTHGEFTNTNRKTP